MLLFPYHWSRTTPRSPKANLAALIQPYTNVTLTLVDSNPIVLKNSGAYAESISS